ncbi:MAG TPA: hypothetical protein VMR86_20370 [Myxococcota bacterium]|nr:hypothetical protein [Myxococcota bacterium]
MRRASGALVLACALAGTGCFRSIAESELPSDPIALIRDAPSEGILSVDQFRQALTLESPDDDVGQYKQKKLRTSLALLYLQTGQVQDVPDVGSTGMPLDWSSDGARLLVARVDPADGTLRLWTWNRFTGAWVLATRNRSGLGAGLADGPIRLAWHGSVSLPGGKHGGAIWINTDDGGDQLLPDTVGCWTPDVSPDGRTVVFARKEAHSKSESTIFLMSLDDKEPHPVTRGSHPRYSRDGRWIVFQREMSTGNTDIWIMRADGGAKRQITRTDDVEEYPSLSPDGRYVAYAATRGDSPSSQIYVARVSDGVEQEVTHSGQNSRPVW